MYFCIYDLQCEQCRDKARQIEELEKENEEKRKIIEEYAKLKEKLSAFLNDDQVEHLTNPQCRNWKPESIVKGMKLRMGLGVHGYKFLYNTKYPMPAYSTLTEKIRLFQLTFGIFDNIEDILRKKVSTLDLEDKCCFLSMDEMEIDSRPCFDKNRGQTYGEITLPSKKPNATASKLLVILIRGMKNNWKQMIACHITSGDVEGSVLKKLVTDCDLFCAKVGLQLVAIGSDMGSENLTLWKALGIMVQRNGVRKNYFELNNRNIFVIPDPCHLLKNLKAAMLKQDLELPLWYVNEKGLPSPIVRGQYIVQIFEATAKNELKELHHLNKGDIYPDNFGKMNVGSAVRFFSTKTAQAIRSAIKYDDFELDSNAESTAHFIEVIDKWFALASSRIRKTSITKRNQGTKSEILYTMIGIFEELNIGSKTWKPLNRGMVMCNLSLIDISSLLFMNGYEFVMFSRCSQDALENVFGSVKRRSGKLPTAKQCLDSLKIMSVCHYMSDISKTNCTADYDFYLLDYFQGAVAKNTNPVVQFRNASILRLNNLSYNAQTYTIADIVSSAYLSSSELNMLYHIAGSSTASFVKHRKLCQSCFETICIEIPEEERRPFSSYSSGLDKGGLIHCCRETMTIILNWEVFYNHLKEFVLHNSLKAVSSYVTSKLNVFNYFNCNYGCDVVKLLVEHFFTVRTYVYCSKFQCQTKKQVYGTATKK